MDTIAKNLNFGADNLATKEEVYELRKELELMRSELNHIKFLLLRQNRDKPWFYCLFFFMFLYQYFQFVS